MGIGRTYPNVGTESPREDYPWRPVKVYDPYSDDQNLIHISPRSCVLAGLDVMGKYPVAGLGIDFRVSELDFVWLVVYFDTNLRPIHAGVCKGPKWTRWYEYGGVSMGGFPRTIKTVRRDHVGIEIGQPNNAAGGYVLPDVVGPELDYLDFELEKEVESISRQGYLNDVTKMGEFKKAMRQELTYFVKDSIQVKQWAAFTLLGYATERKPNITYPFPFCELKKTVAWNNDGTTKDQMTYYYRQACTTHLMLQEVNALGVRACHLTPSFPPYMETLPHPCIAKEGDNLWVGAANGIEGTLPASIANANLYAGWEMAYGNGPVDVVAKYPERAGNYRIVLPEPGENSHLSNEAVGVIGARDARIVYWKRGGSDEHKAARYAAPAVGTLDGGGVIQPGSGHRIPMGGVGEVEIQMMKERCLDSRPIKILNDNGVFTYTAELPEGGSWLNPIELPEYVP